VCVISAKPGLLTGLQTDVHTKFWTDLEPCVKYKFPQLPG